MLQEDELKFERIYKEYSGLIYRLCFLYLKCNKDVEDIFQEIMFIIYQSNIDFTDKQHEKNWIIRASINKCKDVNKNFWNRNSQELDEKQASSSDIYDYNRDIVLKEVLQLKDKYKEVVYLYFYEQFNVPNISRILKKNENTIYSLIRRAKKILKERLGEDFEQ